ncbi:phospholipase D family protein [Labilibaculum sp.]|uniref:phospholipase D family protein n=1 Tax=Labilibaculum sp. TaxID=2060723 RepID=UPI002AA7E22A|nr:phospholipase D family protein [Labilibaculum sp.]
MAKFLTTVGNSYYIEQIIINSKSTLTLITPYLKLSRNLIERLSDADKEGVRITLIYGKNELAPQEKKNLFSFKNIEIYFCENLHAKCYHNEDSMIITSMNLYEFSERNNREMGLLIEKDMDLEIYNDTLKEIDSIRNSSEVKKAFSDQGNSTNNKMKLDPDYAEHWNFHLPSLKEILSEKYKNHEVILNDYIRINDFPWKGINLLVNGRIDFEFSNNQYYKGVERINKNRINETLPGIRFYWNYKQLNIYTEKNFAVEIDEEGLKEKVNKFLSIIETVHDKLED